jgi:hypothetical protein
MTASGLIYSSIFSTLDFFTSYSSWISTSDLVGLLYSGFSYCSYFCTYLTYVGETSTFTEVGNTFGSYFT